MQLLKPQVTASGLKRALSETRWCAFRAEDSHDDSQVLSCYLWNVALAAAFQPALHVLEVTLRNSLFDHSAAIVDTSKLKLRTSDCWIDAEPSLLTPRHAADIARAKDDLRRQKREITKGRIVAALGFGFWTGLFDSQYEHGRSSGPRLWPTLAVRAFPFLDKSRRHRAFLARWFYDLRVFRNRIAHHEPIWKLDAPALYENICDSIGWMNTSAMHLVRFNTRDHIDVLCAAGPDLFANDAHLLVGQSR